MALISCPECGRQVSDKAVSCPQCGYPISVQNKTIPEPEKVPVCFYRGSRLYPQVSGTVYVDGQRVGSSTANSQFTVRLSVGHHDIAIESLENMGRRRIENTESCSIDIPAGSKHVNVYLVVREGLGRFLTGAGKRIVIEEITK